MFPTIEPFCLDIFDRSRPHSLLTTLSSIAVSSFGLGRAVDTCYIAADGNAPIPSATSARIVKWPEVMHLEHTESFKS